MMEGKEVELIDYLRVIWKRKGLIIGGTLVATAMVLVVSLSMPRIYEVSRTLKIGRLPDNVHNGEVVEGKPVESPEAVIGRLKDHRVLKTVLEKIHLGSIAEETDKLVSIDPKTNPGVRYTVQAHDAQLATQIADQLAAYIIKVHSRLFNQGMQIIEEHEAHLVQTIRSLEGEIEGMKKVLKNIMKTSQVEAPAVILLQANIEDREKSLANLRKELKDSRLSRIGSENTFVIAADAPPKHPVKPRVKLNVVVGGTLGLMMFTFLAFFLEYIEEARGNS